MVRLTDYVTSGGCACKIGPHILNRVLKAVTPVTNEHVLADMTGADDAGVYQDVYKRQRILFPLFANGMCHVYGLPMMKAKPKWLEIGTGPVKMGL